MSTGLNITIVRIEESGVCDLTQKTGEVAVCVLPGDTEVFVSTTKLLEMIRFEARKLSRKNGSNSQAKPVSAAGSAGGTHEK